MRILVVEDERKLASLMQRELSARDTSVEIAADGQTGLRLATSEHFDLILLDLMLPGMSGLEVLQRLRVENSTIPVLVVSARTGAEIELVAIRAGANGYLNKPFDLAELFARIEALIGPAVPHDAQTIHVSDLELDRSSRQVKRAGRPIELTAKEYALLEFLMSNAGRVISTRRILEQVWDESFSGVANIVEAHVAQLRKKVDEGHDTRLLHSIRGIGYTLHAQS